MDTEVAAIGRLRSEGFTEDFRLDEGGEIRTDDSSWTASDLRIVELLRFEGMSNPSDESMVLALETPEGQRGTLVMPYGPEMTAAQVETSRALLLRRE